MMSQRLYRSFDTVDSMPRDLRECVHEFGLPIVTACLQAKVTQPARIRELVHQIWSGPRNVYQKRIAQNASALGTLDWVLIQAGAGINAKTLVRVLASHSMFIVPREPTPAMVDASMDAVNHMGVVSKRMKHLNRLRAANKAAAKQWWPHLFEFDE